MCQSLTARVKCPTLYTHNLENSIGDKKTGTNTNYHPTLFTNFSVMSLWGIMGFWASTYGLIFCHDFLKLLGR